MDRAPLDAATLSRVVLPRWAEVTVVERTTSTNADLLARPTAADRTALAADEQTAARGRFDRVWTSPPRAGLTASVLLRPAVPLVRWGWLPLLVGVALAEAVQDVSGVATALKWPNDLLTAAGERKLAGVLAQTVAAETVDAVVVGFGLNVSTTAGELPVDTATSLALAGGEGVDRTQLLIAILTRVDARAAQWSDCGGDPDACGLAAAYRERCVTLGRTVRVHGADGTTTDGRAVDIDGAGQLLLEVDGVARAVGAGDVEHLRNA